MKDIEQDDEQLYQLLSKQQYHEAEESMKPKRRSSVEEVVKRYEESMELTEKYKGFKIERDRIVDAVFEQLEEAQ